MKQLIRFLRSLFIPPPRTRAAGAAHSACLCPVAGCRTGLRRDYPLCGYHAQVLPAPLARALHAAQIIHGPSSPAFAAALRAAVAALDRQRRG